MPKQNKPTEDDLIRAIFKVKPTEDMPRNKPKPAKKRKAKKVPQ